MALIYPLGLIDTDFSDAETGPAWQPEVFAYGAHIVIPSSGTVTLLGAKVRVGSGTLGLKFGLYNSAGTLEGSSTATITATSLTWLDSGAVSIPVVSGTYYLLISCASNVGIIGTDTAGDGSTATEAYASFPVASETISALTETGLLYGVRLDFTAGSTDYSSPTGGIRKPWRV